MWRTFGAPIMKPKVLIYFDSRKVITVGENVGRSHVKIMVSFYEGSKRIRRYYKTDVFCTREEFDKIMNARFGRGNDDLKEKREKLLELEQKAKDCADDFVNPDDFEMRFTSAGNYRDPLGLMLAYAEEMKEAGRIGNQEYYEQAHSSFQKFANEYYGGVLSFVMITPKVLMKYEKWMIDLGKSITTVAMYCRAMRTIFNIARSDKKKIIPNDLYPFGNGKYQIPSAKGRKLALSEEQKNKILTYNTLNPTVQKAVDFWKLSYFCNGMNFTDIARLKYSDIKDGILLFERKKSELTKREKESIEIPIRAEVMAIINKWGNKTLNPNEYIFPVLRPGLTPSQVNDRIHDFIADTNEGLAIACEELGLPKITTYWARHTFATIALRKGAGIEFIQEALGHSSPETTKNYLDGFDIETKKKIANLL